MWLIQIRALRKKLQLTLRRKGVRKRRRGWGRETGSGGRERGWGWQSGREGKGASNPLDAVVTTPGVPECRESPWQCRGQASSSRVRGKSWKWWVSGALGPSPLCTPDAWQGWGGAVPSQLCLLYLSCSFCCLTPSKTWSPWAPARDFPDLQVSSQHSVFSQDCGAQLSSGGRRDGPGEGLVAAAGVSLPRLMVPMCTWGPELFSREPLRRVKRVCD